MWQVWEPSWEVLAAVVARASEAVAIFDRKGRCLYVNPAAEQLVGRSRAELLEGGLREQWPEAVVTGLERVLGRVSEGRACESGGEGLGLPAASGGEEPWLRPEVFEVGDAVGVLWRDVTSTRWRAEFEEALARRAVAERAEEALRRSERKFRRLYESGLLGIFFGDPNGQVVEANDAFLALIGYDREDLAAGRVNWRAMTPPEYAPRDEKAVEELCRLGMFTPYEKQYVRKDGVRIPVMLGGALSDQRDAAVAFVLDITDRKRAEEAREALVEQLQRSVHFSELFVGILGHDLRNPLNAILAAAWHLSQGEPTARISRFAATIVASGRRMERMIEHLLDFTRIRLGQGLAIEPRPMDLGAMVRAILDELESAYLGRTLALRCDGDLTGPWDGDRLGQVVSNLVGNALQYGDAERPVMVTLDGTRAEAVFLEVHSIGPPIPPERLDTLFEPFFPPPPRRRGRQNRGLGLGLYITQQIVLAHGGSIKVESSAEAGTTFRVRLPRISQA